MTILNKSSVDISKCGTYYGNNHYRHDESLVILHEQNLYIDNKLVPLICELNKHELMTQGCCQYHSDTGLAYINFYYFKFIDFVAKIKKYHNIHYEYTYKYNTDSIYSFLFHNTSGAKIHYGNIIETDTYKVVTNIHDYNKSSLIKNKLIFSLNFDSDYINKFYNCVKKFNLQYSI